MATYSITAKQRAALKKDGYVHIIRDGKKVRVTPSMARRERKRKPQTTLRSKKFGRRVLVKGTYQTGKSNERRDKAIKGAMAPGKRRSARGKIYYEYRKNRSDLKGNV